MIFPLGFHGCIDVFEDDEGLTSHAYVFFGNDLDGWMRYIDDFPVFLENIKECIFEFFDGYFFIEVVDVNGVVGS